LDQCTDDDDGDDDDDDDDDGDGTNTKYIRFYLDSYQITLFNGITL